MAFRSSSKATSAATTCVVPACAGIEDNDILVLASYVYDVNTHTITLPAGFTAWYTYGPEGSYRYFQLAWKRASSESGDYTLTISGETSRVIDCYLAAFSGRVASGDPATDSDNTHYSTADTAVRAYALTAAAGDDVFVFGGARNGTPAETIAAFGNAATTLGEYENATYGTATTAAYKENVSAGDTGNFDATISTAVNTKHGISVALAKAPVSASSTPTRSGRFHIGPFSC